jgi:hypothetical protein
MAGNLSARCAERERPSAFGESVSGFPREMRALHFG